ncbi:hypothetical protein [Pseudomonas rubra]|uniref:Uncharacterized protein n=1 Tax=Pseudomonas rubra TaxID=2942627 RepID=A0ABT5PF73_9PSED|nr:hypothetical protein [Pseudomonas rubra]MDD1016962.1 hypothetical protein [Pseudomonas rubra]MDD1041041.1 hypothetical protein [Pseudomonas rubra]MDD1157468.1 hypothetical protein [Pseudomonas rubra]
MSTICLEGFTHAASRAYFERNQEWPDTPENRRLLAGYEATSRNSSRYAIAALKAEREESPNIQKCKAQAAYWETVAETLEAVLSMVIAGGAEEIVLSDPWYYGSPVSSRQ